MRGGKSKYHGVDNGDGFGSARRGYNVSNIWITGVGDELSQCQSLSAVFLQEFIVGKAGPCACVELVSHTSAIFPRFDRSDQRIFFLQARTSRPGRRAVTGIEKYVDKIWLI